MSDRVRRRLLSGIELVLLSALVLPAPALAAGDTTPPTTPTDVRVTTLSYTWLTVAWNPSTDNAGPPRYEVRINEVPLSTTWTGGTTQSFGGLQAGVGYTASVVAIDLAGNRSAAATVPFTTLPRTGPPPAAPANLRPVLVNGALHGIAWDAVPYGTPVSYQLFSGADSVHATSGTGVTVFELLHHVCLDPGSAHTFTVQAIGEHNYLSTHSAPLTVTLP